MSQTKIKELSQTDSMLLQIQNNILTDLAGPKLIKIRHIINLFKGTTFLWVLFLMHTYNNYSTGLILYLILHGSYGIVWVVKDLTFPDPKWNAKASIGSNLFCILFLTLYWLIPVPLAAGFGISEPSNQRIIFLVSLYLLGLVLMMGSDYQKYRALKAKPGLISSGFFKYTRNPNYLGQIMIYSSFVLCSGHLLGFIILYGIACLFFALSIYLKDKTSYQLKKGWEQYKQQSYILLPKIFKSLLPNLICYAIASTLLVAFLCQEHPQSFSNLEFSHMFQKQIEEIAL